MNSTQFIPPVTFEEFRFQFKLTLGKMKKDTKIEYSVVQLHNQFKVVGLITKSPFISTFTIDFTPDIPRRFVDCDMPALVLSIKNNFYSFMQSSHTYATPYGNHTEQTVFYYLVQMNIKIMDTINYIPQQQTQFLSSVGVSPSLLPEHAIYPVPQPPTLTQLMPPPPPLCPNPAPAFQISFIHICERFHQYSTYATLPLICKKKKKVTFSDVVQVRLIVEQQFEYHELITQ